MIILTAGHTGPNSGAQCATTQFNEGAENIWLRNRIAEILTNDYGLVVLMDDDRASLKLLTQALTEDLSLTELTENTEDAVAAPAILSPTDYTDNTDIIHLFPSDSLSCCARSCSTDDTDNRPLSPAGSPPNSGGQLYRPTDFVIDLHFNAHGNPQARGTEAIVADDATTLELRFASRLVHTTSDALDIPLRCIKSESETPHHRLAMLHLTPQSIILEVCFCTSPEDVEAYRKNREKLAADLAWAIYELL